MAHCTTTSSPRSPPSRSAHTRRGSSLSGSASIASTSGSVIRGRGARRARASPGSRGSPRARRTARARRGAPACATRPRSCGAGAASGMARASWSAKPASACAIVGCAWSETDSRVAFDDATGCAPIRSSASGPALGEARGVTVRSRRSTSPIVARGLRAAGVDEAMGGHGLRPPVARRFALHRRADQAAEDPQRPDHPSSRARRRRHDDGLREAGGGPHRAPRQTVRPAPRSPFGFRWSFGGPRGT